MDFMGKTLFVLKIVVVLTKCKAQPHRLYLIKAFLSQKEKGKTLLGFKQKSVRNLGQHFLTLKPSHCRFYQVSTIHLDLHPCIFFTFLICVVGHFFPFCFWRILSIWQPKINPVPIIQRIFVRTMPQCHHISKEFVLENHHI